MIAVVRNGVCEIHNHLGHRLVTLPPVNIDEAVLQEKYVAVVLRNGYCQLYLTSGERVCTYTLNDVKFVKFHSKNQLALYRRNGMVEYRDFQGRLARVKS